MSRIAYVNGRYLPHARAGVSIDDRAFVFGDGVYEGLEVRGGKIVDLPRHMTRLRRSLDLVRMDSPIGFEALGFVLREVVDRNRVSDGFLYMQISRGAAARDHAFPTKPTKPGLVVTVQAFDRTARDKRFTEGVAVITRPDERWAHPHIKTLQLLPNVLAKQAARERGAYECWFVDTQGFVTEGASTNAWIVTRDGTLVTRQADDSILRGVTRTTLLDAIAASGRKVEERPFSLEEAHKAAEAFFSSATTIATPVVRIDDHRIGDGRPGPVTRDLLENFHRHAAT